MFPRFATTAAFAAAVAASLGGLAAVAPDDAAALSPEVGGGAKTRVAERPTSRAAKRARPRVPTRLWYRVVVSFRWKHTYEETWRESSRKMKTTSNGAWTVRTPPEEENEAVLVRRTPGTGAFRFGRLGGLAEGMLVKSTWRTEGTFGAGGPNESKCDPATSIWGAKLDGHAPITALVTLTSEGFGALVDRRGGTSSIAYETGAVTCDPCTGSHPFIGVRPEYVGGTSFACRFDPGSGSTEHVPQVEVPYHHQGLRNLVASMHRFRLPRFGGPRMSATSTASSFVKYPRTSDHRTIDVHESVTETVEFKFQRCPGRGRRSC